MRLAPLLYLALGMTIGAGATYYCYPSIAHVFHRDEPVSVKEARLNNDGLSDLVLTLPDGRKLPFLQTEPGEYIPPERFFQRQEKEVYRKTE